jgi:four helix bundle protein
MKDEHHLPYQRLDAYLVAKDIARRVSAAKISDRELREQATASAKSTFLRLCEGLPNHGVAMRNKYFVESDNSLHETLGAVDLAAAMGVMRDADAAVIQQLGVRLRAMLRGLMRPR